jgi:hypothetical protein
LVFFERGLIAASRGARPDWASRHVLPIVEELATERLMDSKVRPPWLVWAALALTASAAFAFTRGWLGAALTMLALATPLDLIAKRLGTLRLRPLPPRALYQRLLWPAAGLALLALGWWLARHGGGWGAFVTAFATCAFGEAERIERGGREFPGSIWLFSRRNAILGAVPFALFGAWLSLLVTLAAYAAGSFFYVQHWHHRIVRD